MVTILRPLVLLAAALALVGVAVWLPAGNGVAGNGLSSRAAPVVRHPAWPAWAHGRTIASASSAPAHAPGSSMAAQRNQTRQVGGEQTAVADAGVRPGSPQWTARPLWFPASRLEGIALPVQSPPPRSA